MGGSKERGRVEEGVGVCVITVLSLPLFQLRLNHATQKQKQEREREKGENEHLYFLFAFVLACVHFGVLSLQMQNADVALSLLRETILSHRFFTLLAGFLFQFVGLKQFL